MLAPRRGIGALIAMILVMVAIVWWTVQQASQRAPAVVRPAPAEQTEAGAAIPPETTPIAWHEWSDATFARARRERLPVVALVEAAWSESCHLYAAWLAASSARAQLEGDVLPVRVDIDQRPDVHARFHTTYDTLPTLVLLTPQGHVWEIRAPLPAAELTAAIDALGFAEGSDVLDPEIAMLRAQRTTPVHFFDSNPEAALQARLPAILEALVDAWPHPEDILDLDTQFLVWDALGFLRAHAEATNSAVSRALILQGLRQLLASPLLRNGAFWREAESMPEQVSRARFLETNAALLEYFDTAARWHDEPAYRNTADQLQTFLHGTLFDASAGLFRTAQSTLVLNENGWPLLTGAEYASMRAHDHGASLAPHIVAGYTSAANARTCVAFLQVGADEVAFGVLGVLWDAFAAHEMLPHDFTLQSGVLQATTRDFAMDYADVGRAFLAAAAHADDAAQWVSRARALADRLLAEFHDSETGLFFDARAAGANAPQRMHVRLTPAVDNARVARFLRLLAVHTGEARYDVAALQALAAWGGESSSYDAWEACEFGLAILR